MAFSFRGYISPKVRVHFQFESTFALEIPGLISYKSDGTFPQQVRGHFAPRSSTVPLPCFALKKAKYLPKEKVTFFGLYVDRKLCRDKS